MQEGQPIATGETLSEICCGVRCGDAQSGVMRRLYHRVMLQGHATRTCHNVMPQGHATRSCHKVMPQGHVTGSCHRVVPQSYEICGNLRMLEKLRGTWFCNPQSFKN